MVLSGFVATGEPAGKLVHADDSYAADNPNAPRANATLLALVRNEEVDDMVESMKDLERTWNSKFNYPWTFFNDVPFTSDFKRKTQAVTKAKCYYGQCIQAAASPGLMARRDNTQGALGGSVVDRQVSVRRVCQDPRRKRHPVRCHGVLSPDVPLE